MSRKRCLTEATPSDSKLTGTWAGGGAGRGTSVTSSGVGKLKEDEACQFLEAMGYRVVERNFRTRTGEIDIVARLGETLVFVEVRYRREGCLVTAAESVTARKAWRIRSAVERYLAVRRIPDGTPVRIDLCIVRDDRESSEVVASIIETG